MSKITSMLTIPLTISVTIIFLLRIIGKNKDKTHFINRWNRLLRKSHISYATALIIVSAIHGFCSDTSISNPFWGIICMAMLLLLAASYMFRKKLSNWMMWHRILTLLFLITLVLHIVQVSGHEERRSDAQLSSSAIKIEYTIIQDNALPNTGGYLYV